MDSCDKSIRNPTSLSGGTSQASDEFVQSCFEHGELVLFNAQLLLGLDVVRLQLLFSRAPVLEF